MTITGATRSKVARNPCASTGATVGSLSALLLWFAPQVGLDMPLWIAGLLTGLLITFALSFSGLRGVWRFIMYGRGG